MRRPAVIQRSGGASGASGHFGLRALGHRESAFFAPRVVPLHAMITSAGYCLETSPRYDWHGLKRGNAEFILFQHTLSGRGQLVFEGGREQSVEPGATMLLNLPHDHRYFLAPGKNWEFFYLCLTGSEITRLWRELVGRTGPLVTLEPRRAALSQAAHVCAEVLRNRVTSPFQASAMAYALTQTLLEETFVDPASVEKPPFVAHVEAFCQANFAKPIGVADMAQAAAMSRHHFSRRFHAETGVSPAKFLNELRLSRAADLVRSTDASVADVAARTGFSDESYFCKVFRKRFGVSPGSLKKSGMY